MSELAERLRAYFEADAAYAVARHSMQHTIASEWTDDERAQYLRGYDDAKAEMDPYIEKLERENEAMTARVRELEWALGTPHAAGKVLAWVRGTERMDEVNSYTYKDYQSAKDMAGLGHTYKRVAAIVDIAQPAEERDG
jgi:hypothetical protein